MVYSLNSIGIGKVHVLYMRVILNPAFRAVHIEILNCVMSLASVHL